MSLPMLRHYRNRSGGLPNNRGTTIEFRVTFFAVNHRDEAELGN